MLCSEGKLCVYVRVHVCIEVDSYVYVCAFVYLCVCAFLCACVPAYSLVDQLRVSVYLPPLYAVLWEADCVHVRVFMCVCV